MVSVLVESSFSPLAPPALWSTTDPVDPDEQFESSLKDLPLTSRLSSLSEELASLNEELESASPPPWLGRDRRGVVLAAGAFDFAGPALGLAVGVAGAEEEAVVAEDILEMDR